MAQDKPIKSAMRFVDDKEENDAKLQESVDITLDKALREQVYELLKGFGDRVYSQTKDGWGWRGTEPIDEIMKLVEQAEIAARIDELNRLYVSHNAHFETDSCELIKKRIAELTAKQKGKPYCPSGQNGQEEK